MENQTVQTPKATLPQSIVLGGTTYLVKDHPELTAFISQVAQVEKTKVYSTISELEKGIKDLQKFEAPIAQPLELESFKASLLADVRGVVSEIVKPIQDQFQSQRQETIEEYRTKVIAANANVCMPELVTGTTKEEIDASLKESIRLRQTYSSPNSVTQPGGLSENNNVPSSVKDAATQAELEFAQRNVPGTLPAQQPNQTEQQPAVTVIAPPVGATTTPQIITPPVVSAIQESPVDIKNLSPEEFKSKRQALEAQIKSLVPGQA